MRRLAFLATSLLLLAPACGDSGAGTLSDTAEDTQSSASSEGGSESSSEGGGSEGGSETGVDACIPGGIEMKSGENKMETFGAPCTTNDECNTILGVDNAECITNVLDLYDAPGGYCTIPCTLPDDNETKYVPDSPDCGNVGAMCMGLHGFFEACAVTCESDEECHREGYVCRLLPQLGGEGEPKFCLMPDECGPPS